MIIIKHIMVGEFRSQGSTLGNNMGLRDAQQSNPRQGGSMAVERIWAP